MPTIQTFAPVARPVAKAFAPTEIPPTEFLPRGPGRERLVGRLAVELFFDEAGDAANRARPARFRAEVPLSQASFAGRLGARGAGVVVGDGATRLHLVLYVSNEEAHVGSTGSADAVSGAPANLRDAVVGESEHSPATATLGRPWAEPEVAPAPRPAARERVRTPLPVWRLKRTLAYLEAHLSERVTLADLAAAAGLTRMHFAAQFRVATGSSPHTYLLRRRIERAKELMCETSDSLVAVALDVGFQTQAHFSTVFKRHVGETPHRWRRANAGKTIAARR